MTQLGSMDGDSRRLDPDSRIAMLDISSSEVPHNNAPLQLEAKIAGEVEGITRSSIPGMRREPDDLTVEVL